jgi:uncharacterized protein (DUF1697 family)
MTTYVALLRGINVGGRAKVAMPALRELFEALGHEGVQTYIASGNVVFRSAGRRSPTAIVTELEERIAADLGVPAKVLLRTAAELAKVVAANPYADAPPKSVYATFLAAKPTAAKAEAAAAAVPAGETATFHLAGREVYLHLTAGYSDTKLNNAFFEKHLGAHATTRGWPTVLKLLDLAGRHGGG